MDTPLACYKYRSGAAALRSLREGTAYFASPNELNDTLEAKFDASDHIQFAKVFYEPLDELARTRGFPHGLSIPAHVPVGLEGATQEENDRFREACGQVGIFSAATRSTDQAMWAYYCNDGRGVCFVLEWPQEILSRHSILVTPVNYTEKPRVHNRADDFRTRLLALGRQNPNWTMAQIEAFSLTESFGYREGMEATARAVSVKHSDWAHEREIRFIKAKAGPVRVMSDVLRGVIFTRTDFPEWGEIMTLLHRDYPSVGLAQLSFDHNEPFVKFQPVTLKQVPLKEV